MDEDGRYPRWQVEGLIFGEYPCPDWCSCGSATHDAEEWCWSRLRARMEHHGMLDGAWVSLVLDLERALHALYLHHPDAAAAVLAQMFFEPGHASDMTAIFGPRSNPGRWIDKALAWLTAYLNGKPITAPRGTPSCESAYRSAK